MNFHTDHRNPVLSYWPATQSNHLPSPTAHHSARNASNGSNRAAFIAGATPAAMPISNETTKAATI